MPIKVVHKNDTAYDTHSVCTPLTSTLQQTNNLPICTQVRLPIHLSNSSHTPALLPCYIFTHTAHSDVSGLYRHRQIQNEVLIPLLSGDLLSNSLYFCLVYVRTYVYIWDNSPSVQVT